MDARINETHVAVPHIRVFDLLFGAKATWLQKETSRAPMRNHA
jgi:hypothetical protein